MTFPRSAWIISKAFITEFGWLSGGRSILHGAWQLLKAAFTPESDLSRARMECCLTCHMKNQKLGTCGTPGETWEQPVADWGGKRTKKHTLGCWCYLPLAARLPEKDCWAKANAVVSGNGTPFGWPDELRPKTKP